MSEKSSSSGSDDDVDPESGHPVELGGILSKVTCREVVLMCLYLCALMFYFLCLKQITSANLQVILVSLEAEV